MATNARAKVYTGATAALKVKNEEGILKTVAYVTDFTIDLNSNTEDFKPLGQIYQESFATYNDWSASSSAKASFEDDGQRLLLQAFQNLKQIFVEFDVDTDSQMMMFGWASIESLSIGVGDSISSLDISLKGSGNLAITLPSYNAITSIKVIDPEDNEQKPSVSLNLKSAGSSTIISYVVEPSNASNPKVIFESKDTSKVKVDQDGFVYAVAETSTPVEIKLTAEETIGDETPVTATVNVTVGATDSE